MDTCDISVHQNYYKNVQAQHLTTLVDSDHTRGHEDLIICVKVEPLCCIFEPNIRLYVNDTSIKEKDNDIVLESLPWFLKKVKHLKFTFL